MVMKRYVLVAMVARSPYLGGCHVTTDHPLVTVVTRKQRLFGCNSNLKKKKVQYLLLSVTTMNE